MILTLHPNNRLIAVQVPEDARNPTLLQFPDRLRINTDFSNDGMKEYNLPTGKWTLVGCIKITSWYSYSFDRAGADKHKSLDGVTILELVGEIERKGGQTETNYVILKLI